MRTFFDEMRDWLDTETRAMLYPEPPEKVVQVGIESYSLLLLHQGADGPRIAEVVAAIQDCFPPLLDRFPFVIGSEMELEDALAGQFAFACCDCVTAFVRDELIKNAAASVFRQLHSEIMQSREFQSIEVEVSEIPQTEAARRFCWQFFGMATGLKIPAVIRTYRKKARMMEHWAPKAGILLSIHD